MKRVLLAEDTDIWVKIYTKLLTEQFNFSVVVAPNGAAACNEIKNEKFDLIICDHYMPRRDGSEVYAYARNSGRSKNKETHFIHHSSAPCPEIYKGSSEDMAFYSIYKNGELFTMSSHLEDLGFERVPQINKE